jgi:uncharacterized delta-60 repeat protein
LARFALARYNPDGTLDSTFSGDGKLNTHFTKGQDAAANAVAIQADGNIVAAGFSGPRFALARYNPNGSLDSSFGGDGKITTRFRRKTGDTVSEIAIQSDGKIVAVGTSVTGLTERFRFALARYNGDGSLDPSFGGDGKLITTFGKTGDDSASAVALQPDGKIVAAGQALVTVGKFALARYNTDGSLDQTFGGDGRVTTHLSSGSDDVATDVALQNDGRIVAGGSSQNVSGSGHSRFALIRYNADGSLDSTFGTGGKVTTHFGSGTNDFGSGLALQADDKLVAAGTSSNVAYSRFAVARYLGS